MGWKNISDIFNREGVVIDVDSIIKQVGHE